MRLLVRRQFAIAATAFITALMSAAVPARCDPIILSPVSTSTEILIDPGSPSQQVVQDPTISIAPAPFVGQGIAGNQNVQASSTSTSADDVGAFANESYSFIVPGPTSSHFAISVSGVSSSSGGSSGQASFAAESLVRITPALGSNTDFGTCTSNRAGACATGSTSGASAFNEFIIVPANLPIEVSIGTGAQAFGADNTSSASANGSASLALSLASSTPLSNSSTAPGPAPGPSAALKQFYTKEEAFFTFAAEAWAILAIPTAIICIPCALTQGVFSAVTGAVAIIFRELDPPDFNFTSIAAPNFPSVPSLPASACLTNTTAPAINDLLNKSTQILGLGGAALTSFNRATGAYLSNSPTFEQLQLNAANQYSSEIEADTLAVSNDLNALSSLLSSACTDPTFTVADVAAFQQNLINQGFPASYVTELENLGVDPSDISELLNIMETADPNGIAGTYPQDFSVLASEIAAADPATAVPEPSTVYILIVGMFFLGSWQVWRRAV